MAAEIGIKIGADVSGIVSGSKAAGIALTDFGKIAANQSKAFDAIGNAADAAFKKISDAANKANGGGNTFKPFGDPGYTIRSLDQIEAEIRKVNDAIGTNKDLSQFIKLDEQLKKLELEARNLRVVGFESTIRQGGVAAGTAAGQFGKLKLGSNEAGIALSNVGRVAQDLPFGFLGIQNNLNPLLESFQRLKASTGSTGSALKALAGSLLGAGGLGLALSVVSAGILIYQNGISGFNSKTKAAKEASDEFGKSLQGIVNSIGEEATKVSGLVSALQSETTSRKEKKAAIEELKRINPEYFSQLSIEKGLVNNLQLAYQGYIESLKQQFAAKALDKQLTELFNKKLDLEIKLTPVISTAGNQKISEDIARLQKNIEKLDPGGKLQAKNFLDLTGTESKTIQQINNIKSAIATIQTPISFTSKQDNDELKKINGQIDSLISRRAKFENFGIVVPKDPKAPSAESELNKQITAINKEIAALEELQKAGLATRLDVQKLFSLKIDKVNLELPKSGFTPAQAGRLIEQLQTDANEALKATPPQLTIPKIEFKSNTSAALKSAIDAGKGISAVIKDGLNTGIRVGTKDITSDISTLLNDSIVGGLADFGNSIGDALSGAGFDKVLKTVGSTIGQFIQDFGKLLIKSGIEIDIIKKGIKALNLTPLAAVAIGVAAVAVGAIIKNAAKGPKQKGFRTGGIADGPSSGYFALLHGKEVIAPYDKAAALLGGGNNNGMGIVQFQISGDNLKGILQKVEKTRGRI